MVSAQQAQMALDELKHGVIGIYQEEGINYLVTDYYEEVESIDCIQITDLGAIHDLHNMPLMHSGQLHFFPDNLSMAEMLDRPYGWVEFMKNFK